MLVRDFKKKGRVYKVQTFGTLHQYLIPLYLNRIRADYFTLVLSSKVGCRT